mgnify:CR=1 FL=1
MEVEVWGGQVSMKTLPNLDPTGRCRFRWYVEDWIDAYSLLADGLGLQGARVDDAAVVETNSDTGLGLGSHLVFS